MALSESGNLQSNKLQRGPSLRLELELTPPKDSRGSLESKGFTERSATEGSMPAMGSFTGAVGGYAQPVSESGALDCQDSSPNIAARDSAAIEAGSAGDQDPRGHVTGQPASPLNLTYDSVRAGIAAAAFYRPRFIVLPTGRTMLAWGIWDCQKNPLGSLPTCIFKMSDFVHRTRSLGKAYAFARRLNEKHERKAAA